MTSNLYKVGDWVYCEVSPFQPYVIRKIEELTKTPNGNVEAKVICAFRYQDIPSSVMESVEKYQSKASNDPQKPELSASNTDTTNSNSNSSNTTNTPATQTSAQKANEDYYDESEVSELNELQRYNLKHRELFFSKYTDTIAATTIRSKCSVLLFNEEVERYFEYLSKDDQFYYHLTYDPSQKSLVADKGEIRVGFRYQAEIPHLKFTPNGSVLEDGSTDAQSQHQIVTNDRVLRSQLQRMNSQKEHCLPEVPIGQQTDEIFNWCPSGSSILSCANLLTDSEIDKFLILAKSVGTFARALDCNNAFKQPSLPLSAAAASRDITLFHAMNCLHENNYDVGKAAMSLITQSGPVLCKDELEDWSAVEANLFEDALEKYGKDFNEIKKDYLPWKSMRSLIEYYYTWKTTDRYIAQKRVKLAEQESKLKQVYIPNHSKQNQSALIKSSHVQLFNQYDVHLKNSCDSCGAPNTSTNQWYAYSPTNLVQLIMSGNTNPTLLANAQAQAVASLQTTASATNLNPSTHIYQSRLCSDCWTYYKKFFSFKYPNAKYERLNQLKNQLHKCSVNGCGREFKMKQLLIKHCGIAHGYFAKTNNPPGQNDRPPAIRNRTAFYLYTTPMTKAARYVCTRTVKLKKLAKKPFKLVELAELNKEWSKETRTISQLNQEAKSKAFRTKRYLDVKLISVIAKNRAKLLRQKNSNLSEDDENSNDLIIDQESSPDEEKPDYFKYFEKKCTTPCYIPENIRFTKQTSEQINKFHLNLMSQTQSRKRPHDQLNGQSDQSKSGLNENDSNECSPQSKRSLLIPNRQLNEKTFSLNHQVAKEPLTTETTVLKPHQARGPQKSVKPVQSINLPNSPEDIYYIAVPGLKTLRRDVESVSLRRLARKPNKLMGEQYQAVYQTLEKMSVDSMMKFGKPVQVALEINNETSNDTLENENGEGKKGSCSSSSSSLSSRSSEAQNGLKSSKIKGGAHANGEEEEIVELDAQNEDKGEVMDTVSGDVNSNVVVLD